MEYLDKKTMEKKLRKENAGLSYKELRKLWPAYRKKEIEKEIKESGYLSFSELLIFLKEKGATIDPETKNLVRFATNNDLKIKRFGRVGKAGYDSAYFQKPSPEKIKEIIEMLRNNNNTLPGRKALKEKKREIIKVFNDRSYVFQAEVEFWSLANQDKEVRNRSQELYEKIINLFELVLNKGVRHGEFNIDDTRLTAISILSVFQGINWFCIFNDSKNNAKNYILNSIDIIITGLSKS